MNEYSKDEIVNFFKSVVNPVLSDFATQLKERGWQTNPQICNPDEPNDWLDNKFSASINASKDGGAWLHYFCVAATPTTSSNRYHVMYRKIVDQPVSGLSGGTSEGEYRRDINRVTKEQFRKDVEKEEPILL
jgi:hypothetical protein